MITLMASPECKLKYPNQTITYLIKIVYTLQSNTNENPWCLVSTPILLINGKNPDDDYLGQQYVQEYFEK